MAILLTTNYQLISSFNLTYGAIRTYAKYNSQSKENNQTYYQLKQVYYCSQSGGYVGFNYGSGWVDGSERVYDSYTRMYYGETVIQEVNRTLNHNTDGSSPIKNVPTSWSASFGGGGSTSVDIIMPKIDRYPMLTGADSFNDEGNPRITYTTTLGFSGASVQACIASPNGQTVYVPYRNVNVSNGSYTFQLTNEERTTLRNATPNSNTLPVKFYLRTTTTGGTTYYSTLDRQMTIVNANPTFTHVESELNENVIDLIGSSATSVIQNASYLNLLITPTTLKGSTIKSVSVTHNNVTNTMIETSPCNFAINVVNGDFIVKVTDSRGNSTSATISKTLITYTPININSYSFTRVNPTSSNVVLQLESDYEQKTFGSTVNAPIVKWKLDDGSYTTIPSSEYTIDTTNKKLTLNYTISNILVYTSSGQFAVSVEDILTSDVESGATGYVTRGVPTTEKGEHDFQVNGHLYIADTNRQNKGEVFPNIYSTTERVVGIAEDGKSIYRSRITYSVSTGNTSHDVSSLNIKEVYFQNHQCVREFNGHTDYEGSYYSNSSDYFRAFVRVDTKTIETRLQNSATANTQISTIEYTKTTD